ncbi:hypothetical protein AB1Y20_022934 [Prymnesium parvum]|uniref:PPPDE domain-containing protein n=1 Tax=Prymnesium parvum TaxID=97485 RepID=A0AB34JCK5_PRYPA
MRELLRPRKAAEAAEAAAEPPAATKSKSLRPVASKEDGVKPRKTNTFPRLLRNGEKARSATEGRTEDTTPLAFWDELDPARPAWTDIVRQITSLLQAQASQYRCLKCCLPTGRFNWANHLCITSIRGVYTINEDPVSEVAARHDALPDRCGLVWRCYGPMLEPGTLELPMPIWLHCYHVRGNRAIRGLNTVSRDILRLGGIFHSGVELNGFEWCFGATRKPCSGVFCSLPKRCPFHLYHTSIFLGIAHLSTARCVTLLTQLAREWRGDTYNLLHRNCNHFSLALARELEVETNFPHWLVKHSSGIPTASSRRRPQVSKEEKGEEASSPM